MLMPDFTLEPMKMMALGFAFGATCEELGIGDGSLEVEKRERVSRFWNWSSRAKITSTFCIVARSFISETHPHLCDRHGTEQDRNRTCLRTGPNRSVFRC